MHGTLVVVIQSLPLVVLIHVVADVELAALVLPAVLRVELAALALAAVQAGLRVALAALVDLRVRHFDFGSLAHVLVAEFHLAQSCLPEVVPLRQDAGSF